VGNQVYPVDEEEQFAECGGVGKGVGESVIILTPDCIYKPGKGLRRG